MVARQPAVRRPVGEDWVSAWSGSAGCAFPQAHSACTTSRPARCPHGTAALVTSTSPEEATSSSCTELPQLRRSSKRPRPSSLTAPLATSINSTRERCDSRAHLERHAPVGHIDVGNRVLLRAERSRGWTSGRLRGRSAGSCRATNGGARTRSRRRPPGRRTRRAARSSWARPPARPEWPRPPLARGATCVQAIPRRRPLCRVPGMVRLALALAVGTALFVAAPAAAIDRYVPMRVPPGPGPAKYDRVFVQQLGPAGAKNVLVLVPGTNGGRRRHRARGARHRQARAEDAGVDRRSAPAGVRGHVGVRDGRPAARAGLLPRLPVQAGGGRGREVRRRLGAEAPARRPALGGPQGARGRAQGVPRRPLGRRIDGGGVRGVGLRRAAPATATSTASC